MFFEAYAAPEAYASVGLTHIESTPLPVPLESPDAKRKEGTAAMKNQAIQYLAFDVHQATVVATLRDEAGKVVMRATKGIWWGPDLRSLATRNPLTNGQL